MLKKVLVIIFLGIILGNFSPVFSFGTALAEDYGLNSTAKEVNAFKDQVNSQGISENFIQTRAGQIISFVLSFVGVLFLGLMIYSGLLWMTAQGNETKVTKAKDLLINAVVGLIIVFAAYTITAFIGDFVSNQLLKE